MSKLFIYENRAGGPLAGRRCFAIVTGPWLFDDRGTTGTVRKPQLGMVLLMKFIYFIAQKV